MNWRPYPVSSCCRDAQDIKQLCALCLEEWEHWNDNLPDLSEVSMPKTTVEVIYRCAICDMRINAAEPNGARSWLMLGDNITIRKELPVRLTTHLVTCGHLCANKLLAKALNEWSELEAKDAKG